MNEQMLDDKYWDERYTENNATWDVGEISTPIKEYIDQLEDKHIAVLIPGCGNAHEAVYLIEKGFTNITLIDISPVLVKAIQQKLSHHLDKQLHIVCGDFFDVDQQFDLVIEQTFFCAIDPALRERYADKVYSILKPSGKLVGVLFDRSFETSPPFGGNKAAYEKLFADKFEIKKMEACYNSITRRSGTELFIILKKSS